MTAMTHTPESFWTKMSAKYAAQPIADPQDYEATLARTMSYLSADDMVLEIGAGTSSTALRLAPMVRRYVSSDYSAGMTAIGQEKAFEASIPGLEVVQGQLGDAALGEGPYDAVLALNLLHLVPDLDATLAKAAKLLKPGGLMISKTGCLGRGFRPIRVMISAMQLLGRAPHVGFFSAAELEAAMIRAGFEIIEGSDHGKQVLSRYLVARKV